MKYTYELYACTSKKAYIPEILHVKYIFTIAYSYIYIHNNKKERISQICV